MHRLGWELVNANGLETRETPSEQKGLLPSSGPCTWRKSSELRGNLKIFVSHKTSEVTSVLKGSFFEASQLPETSSTYVPLSSGKLIRFPRGSVRKLPPIPVQFEYHASSSAQHQFERERIKSEMQSKQRD